MSKILVLAAGRRRYVVEALRASMGAEDSLMASDRSADMPGLSVVGVEGLVEPAGTEDFREWLLETCRRESIQGVLSLHDHQTIQVSALRDELRSVGSQWIGPSLETAETMLDKTLLARFLTNRNEGLAIPTYSMGDRLPDTATAWIVKDRLGSGSSGLVVGVARETAQRALDTDGAVVQPQIAGAEWNLDFFFWGDGLIHGISAKRKLRMRGGETDAARVFPVTELPFDVMPVIDAFREIDHLGNVDIDVFVDDDKIQVVDVNPRFGGGYAFSVHAGYRAAEAVWALAGSGVVAPFSVEAERGFTGAKSIEVVGL